MMETKEQDPYQEGKAKLGTVARILQRLRQEDHKIEASLENLVRSCLKNNF
jgi:uncharacterized protein with ATP-grasp and redox domains